MNPFRFVSVLADLGNIVITFVWARQSRGRTVRIPRPIIHQVVLGYALLLLFNGSLLAYDIATRDWMLTILAIVCVACLIAGLEITRRSWVPRD